MSAQLKDRLNRAITAFVDARIRGDVMLAKAHSASLDGIIEEIFPPSDKHHYFDTLDEADRSFDLYRSAVMRGQKLWRDESPEERELIAPDMGNLVAWLLALVARAETASHRDRG